MATPMSNPSALSNFSVFTSKGFPFSDTEQAFLSKIQDANLNLLTRPAKQANTVELSLHHKSGICTLGTTEAPAKVNLPSSKSKAEQVAALMQYVSFEGKGLVQIGSIPAEHHTRVSEPTLDALIDRKTTKIIPYGISIDQEERVRLFTNRGLRAVAVAEENRSFNLIEGSVSQGTPATVKSLQVIPPELSHKLSRTYKAKHGLDR